MVRMIDRLIEFQMYGQKYRLMEIKIGIWMEIKKNRQMDKMKHMQIDG